MSYIEPITPTALKRLHKRERESRAARIAAVRIARSIPCTSNRGWGCAREDAIHVWWMARDEHKRDLRALTDALARPVVKGSHVSPGAKARLVRNGTWIDDSKE